MFNDGWHYYLYAVVKEETVKTTGSGTVGIDIGTSTVAVCSEERCMLEVLGPEIEKYNKEIEKIQEKIDRSVRASNPERFNEDGTAKRIKGRYIQSKRCRKLRNKLRTVYRKKADYLKQSHEELSNRIMKLGDTFYVEKMSFERLAKKAEFDEEEPTKKRKRYGRSLNNRAPSELIGILQRKTGKVIEVNTQKYRASQYDHTTGEYEKTELNRRRKQIGEHIVQRDLYSAYLLSHPLDTERPDTEACIRKYEGFIHNHDKCIEEIVKENKPRLSSFGF